MPTTDFYKIVSLVNSIEAETKRQSQALLIATKAMEEAHQSTYDLVHLIQKMSDRPITENERTLLEHLREIARMLNDAAVSIRDLNGE